MDSANNPAPGTDAAAVVMSDDDVILPPQEWIDDVIADATVRERQADNAYNSAIESIINDLDDRLQKIESDTDSVIHRVEGDLNIVDRKVDGRIDKILTRIETSADRKLTNATNRLNESGVPMPVLQLYDNEVLNSQPVESALRYYYIPNGILPPDALDQPEQYEQNGIGAGEGMVEDGKPPEQQPEPPPPPPVDPVPSEGETKENECLTDFRPVDYYTDDADMTARGYRLVKLSDVAEIIDTLPAVIDESPERIDTVYYWVRDCEPVETGNGEPVPSCPPPEMVVIPYSEYCRLHSRQCEEPVSPPTVPPTPGESGSGGGTTGGSATIPDSMPASGWSYGKCPYEDMPPGELPPRLGMDAWLTATKTGIDNIGNAIKEEVGGVPGEILAGVVQATTWPAVGALAAFAQSMQSVTDGQIRNTEIFGRSIATSMITGIAEKWVGGPWSYLTQSNQYDIQWSCPQFLPAQNEIDALFARGQITESYWECLTRANGNRPDHFQQVRKANSVHVGPMETVQYFQRMNIGQNEGERAQLIEQALKECGVEKPEQRERIKELFWQTPQPSDILSWMVRDAFDDQAVKENGFDKMFDKKFLDSAEAKRLARAAGVSEEHMRRSWYSHWDMPPYTQLVQMLHRLRPGRMPPDLLANLPANLREAITELKPVTPEVIANALTTNDVAPAWVARLCAVSYNTITRTDLLQFFVDGSMEKPEIIERLQDTGYNLQDSQRIADAWELTVVQRRKNRGRTLTIDRIVKYYVDGLVDQGTATTLLSEIVPDLDDVNRILFEADIMRLAEMRRKCITATKKRMMKGEIDALESQRKLIGLGVDRAAATTLADGWICELQSRSKSLTLTMIRKLLFKGSLDITDVYTRMKNLGYKIADIRRIVNDWIDDFTIKMSKQRLAALKAAAANAEKQERERKRENKETLKALQEQAKELDKQRAAIDKQISKLQKDIKPGAAKIGKATEPELSEAAAAKLAAKREKELEGIKDAAVDQINEGIDGDGDLDSGVNNSPQEAINGIDQPAESTGTPDAMVSNEIEAGEAFTPDE